MIMNIPETFLPCFIPIIAIGLGVLFYRIGWFKPTPPYRSAEKEADKHSQIQKLNR